MRGPSGQGFEVPVANRRTKDYDLLVGKWTDKALPDQLRRLCKDETR